MLAITLALASSLTYGVSDFLGGVKSRSVALLGVLLVSQGISLVLLAVIVLTLGGGPPGGTFLLFAALAGVSETVGVAALYRGLAVGVMSIVAPVAATAPVVPVVAGVFLGELPAPIQGAGIVLAVTGIVITSRARSTAEPAVATEPAPAGAGVAASVVFGLLAALGFGSFYVAMDAASEAGVPWALLVARLTAVAIFVVAYSITRSPLAVRGADVPVLALIGVLIVGADAMYAVASTLGLLGVVAVLSSLYPLVTIGLARLYLDERLGRFQQVGIALCLCGAVAVSAG